MNLRDYRSSYLLDPHLLSDLLIIAVIQYIYESGLLKSRLLNPVETPVAPLVILLQLAASYENHLLSLSFYQL